MFKYLSILFLTFQVSLSPAAIVGFNADITNNSSGPANDFHVEIGVSCCAGSFLQTDRFYTGSLDPFTSRIANNFGASDSIDLDWGFLPTVPPTRPSIQLGRTIHVGWEFDDQNVRNSIRYKVGKTYWTDDGRPVPGTQPTLPGFTAASI